MPHFVPPCYKVQFPKRPTVCPVCRHPVQVHQGRLGHHHQDGGTCYGSLVSLTMLEWFCGYETEQDFDNGLTI